MEWLNGLADRSWPGRFHGRPPFRFSRLLLLARFRPVAAWEPPMGKRLFVGNLKFGITEARLRRLFKAHGKVTSVQVIVDRDTGYFRGFGFVEMGSDPEAEAAIAALNGSEMDGRPLTVSEARPNPGWGGSG
jgi:hypothetical protein